MSKRIAISLFLLFTFAFNLVVFSSFISECERGLDEQVKIEVNGADMVRTRNKYDPERVRQYLIASCELKNTIELALVGETSVEEIWLKQFDYGSALYNMNVELGRPQSAGYVGGFEEIQWWIGTMRAANIKQEYVDIEVGPLQCIYDNGLSGGFPPFCDFTSYGETPTSSIIVPGGLEYKRRRLEQYLGDGNLIRAVRHCDYEITPMVLPGALSCPIVEVTVLGISPEGPGGATFDEYGLISYK